MNNRLDATFYTRTDVVQVAKDLLGKTLVTTFDGIRTSGMIVETEAYRAPDDKACHAYSNKRTKRTEVMFHEGGCAYVYLCYGIHHLFNVVTGTEGLAQAVLIRAIQPVDGIDTMLARRKMTKIATRLSAGPGTLSQALGIQTQHTGLSLIDKNSPIWIENTEQTYTEQDITASPRVGVGYAEECASWNWRFRVKDNQWTSKAK